MNLFDKVSSFCVNRNISMAPARQICIDNFVINTTESFFGIPIECLVLDNDIVIDGYSFIQNSEEEFRYKGKSFHQHLEDLRKPVI